MGKYFRGVEIGSHEGVIAERGLETVLVLRACGHEIPCDLSEVPQHEWHVGKRVQVDGRSVYDGVSPLPVLVRAMKVRLLPSGGDITRWRGAFSEFHPDGWDYEP